MSDEPRNQLLQLISELQRRVIRSDDVRSVFDFALEGILRLTGADRGYLGEALHPVRPSREIHFYSRVLPGAGGRAFSGLVVCPRVESWIARFLSECGESRTETNLSPDDLGLDLGPGRPAQVAVFSRRHGEGGSALLIIARSSVSFDPEVPWIVDNVLSALALILHTLAADRDKRHVELEQASFFDLSCELMCVAGFDGRFKRVNPAFVSSLGFSFSELTSRPFLDFVIEEDRERTVTCFSGLLVGRAVVDFENRYRDREGRIHWLSWRANSDPSSEEVLAVARDVTQSKLDEERRRSMDEEIQRAQRLESLGVLAGGVAHDFNNLLLAVLGNCDLALESLEDGHQARANIDDVIRITQRAADLCNQMLAYSGRGRFVLERFGLTDLVQEMADLLVVALSKRATLEFHFASDLPFVEGDPTQIRQVIMNLITNASDALESSTGIIAVTTGTGSGSEPAAFSTQFGEFVPTSAYVYVEVADTGCGMDAETLAKMFEPFFTTKFTGRGLGLSAVLGIVQTHRGVIQVHSTPHTGTTVRISLPAVSVEHKVSDPRTTVDSTWSGGGRRILVVDDEESVRNLTRRILENAGFGVVTAADGAEALQQVTEQATPFDAIILDITMPGRNGAEVSRELRQTHPDLPILLTSGFSEEDAVIKTSARKNLLFIQKPYRPRELLDRLRTLIEPEPDSIPSPQRPAEKSAEFKRRKF